MKRFSAKLTPSPSMVVAMIALVVALSGSAYAAVTINGKNIKKGTITAKQVKDKSLTGTDIKDGSVSGADVKDGSIGNADLTDASVGTSKLADGSVTAGKIASGAIPPVQIGTATSTTAFSPAGITFEDVPGMTINYTAPPGTTKLVITFAAECAVSYTATSQYLTTEILVDGTEAEPSGGSGYQFCTVSETSGYSQTGGSSMTRVIPASPGTHTVKVQAAEIIISNGTLDDMALTVTPSS